MIAPIFHGHGWLNSNISFSWDSLRSQTHHRHNKFQLKEITEKYFLCFVIKWNLKMSKFKTYDVYVEQIIIVPGEQKVAEVSPANTLQWRSLIQHCDWLKNKGRGETGVTGGAFYIYFILNSYRAAGTEHPATRVILQQVDPAVHFRENISVSKNKGTIRPSRLS